MTNQNNNYTMRTKLEIVSYLKENGHTNNAIAKITGFLIGAGIKDNDEKLVFKRGDSTWDDFYDWFENKPTHIDEETPLYNSFAFLFKLRDASDNAAETRIIDRCIMYLIDACVNDVSSNNKNNKKTCAEKNKSH